MAEEIEYLAQKKLFSENVFPGCKINFFDDVQLTSLLIL
jgi:hypothetical protein